MTSAPVWQIHSSGWTIPGSGVMITGLFQRTMIPPGYHAFGLLGYVTEGSSGPVNFELVSTPFIHQGPDVVVAEFKGESAKASINVEGGVTLSIRSNVRAQYDLRLAVVPWLPLMRCRACGSSNERGTAVCWQCQNVDPLGWSFDDSAGLP